MRLTETEVETFRRDGGPSPPRLLVGTLRGGGAADTPDDDPVFLEGDFEAPLLTTTGESPRPPAPRLSGETPPRLAAPGETTPPRRLDEALSPWLDGEILCLSDEVSPPPRRTEE